MSHSPSSSPAPVSWAAATWCAPLVPVAALWTTALLGDAVGADSEVAGGATLVLVCLAILAASAGAALAPSRRWRGVGVGLATGSLVTALGWLVTLA